MNEEELALFLENCQAANLSDADLFRARCCDQKPSRQRRKRSLDEQALASALGQLGKIGGNLNQMAHALNVIKFKPSAEGLLSTITAMERQLARLEADNIDTKQLSPSSLTQS